MAREPDLSSPGSTSESEEMYLITVARSIEEGAVAPVPVADVARRLQVSVASANEMVRKLTVRNLLEYEPYRGVSLTPLGSGVAQRVLRTRRLWATFLAERLGLTPAQADDQACLLEHVTLPDAVERLAQFLGDPDTGPLGRPIPDRTGDPSPVAPNRCLADLAVGTAAAVTRIDGPPAVVSFLAAEGLIPGARVTVDASGAGGVLVRTGTGPVHVTAGLAAAIEVDPGA